MSQLWRNELGGAAGQTGNWCIYWAVTLAAGMFHTLWGWEEAAEKGQWWRCGDGDGGSVMVKVMIGVW